MNRFEGRVAIVTGATGGIGSETARRLAAEGCALVLTGRDVRLGLRLCAELEGRACFVAADLTDAEAPARLVGAALDRHDRLDVLINNAGVDHTTELLETPMQSARDVFDINFFAALAMLQAAARAMREHGGAIVNVTSRLASIGFPTMNVYGASKGALLTLTRGAAVEFAPYGIRVNAVAPGLTRTPLFEAWIASQEDSETAERTHLANTPTGRLATPADVAAAIAYLASEDAAHVTGASVPVDGGYTAA